MGIICKDGLSVLFAAGGHHLSCLRINPSHHSSAVHIVNYRFAHAHTQQRIDVFDTSVIICGNKAYRIYRGGVICRHRLILSDKLLSDCTPACKYISKDSADIAVAVGVYNSDTDTERICLRLYHKAAVPSGETDEFS